MSGYLPDGCTQEDCDRAAGGYDDRYACSGCGCEDCECCEICGTPPSIPCGTDCPNRRPPTILQINEINMDAGSYRDDMECPF